MQFDLLTNLSDPFPKKIVRERLTRVIRLLRGASAVISKESSAVYWMRLLDIVSYIVVANRTILEMERNLQVPLPFIRHIADPIAVSANPTKEKAKHHVTAGTNSTSPQ